MSTASILSDLSRSATIARSLFPAPAPSVRISVVPEPSARATLPPGVRAARMLKTVRRIAASIARGLPRHVEYEDLVGAGSLGLAEAFSRRNGMPGHEFEAFATYRIRGAILDDLRRLDVMSRHDRGLWKRMEAASKTVKQRFGGVPGGDTEIAAELGLRPSLYRELRSDLETQREPISLTGTTGEDDGEREIADMSAAFPEEAATRASLTQLALERLAELPERMRHVLLALYVEGKTLKQAGAELGVTESRACQIHKEALKRLKASIPQEMGAETLAEPLM